MSRLPYYSGSQYSKIPNTKLKQSRPNLQQSKKNDLSKIIDVKEDLKNELNISVDISDYTKYKQENLQINDLISKLIKNEKTNIEEDLDKLLNSYNYTINEYNYISFLDICMLLNGIFKEKKEITNTIKDNIKNLIKKNFNEIILYLKNNYFCNLVFNYNDNENKININIENILNNTIKNLKENFNILENILINIIEDNKFYECNDYETFFNKYIKDIYYKQINNKFIYGYQKSILYNYNNNNKYNIDEKYLLPKYQDKSIESANLYDDIKKNLIYYDIYLKKITKRDKNFSYENKRIILSKEQLNEYYKNYNENISKLVKLKEILLIFKKEQESLLNDIKFINNYSKEIDYNIINNEIKNKIKKILKSNSNIQFNEDNIKNLKIIFKKELDKLNDEIKIILLDKDNIINKIPKYNNFINKYSLYINNIINLINNYPIKSNQYTILNDIFKYYITDEDIYNWINKCKINNLNYWLPVKTKSKKANTFFINLINNKVSWKINNDDLIIYNSNQMNDKIFCWNNSLVNITLPKLDNENDLVKIVLKKYHKANIKVNLNDFTILKPLIDKCIKNKDMIKFENSCKNMITIFDIIKEIVKNKYKFGLNNEKLKNLENDIEIYKKNLLNLLPK